MSEISFEEYENIEIEVTKILKVKFDKELEQLKEQLKESNSKYWSLRHEHATYKEEESKRQRLKQLNELQEVYDELKDVKNKKVQTQALKIKTQIDNI
jgi:hypothetical protein